jgi:formylglycine-generating enzyme required for sulfatase activity/predicted Ser/Thr protein kinase
MELPEQFGRYRILKKLGAGGMGAVYLAEDTALGRRVALKVPHFDKSDSERARQRFLREARAAATLDHPNICHVHDVGEIDGQPYITMAYVEGRPLSEIVEPGDPLPQDRAAGIVRRLALALAQAHAKGIVHRDLKPANVILRADGEPVILDFGLARMPTSEQSRLTAAGAILGTPSYMSPEQVRGEVQAIDARTDVYALGVMLYELLTGHVPFEGVPAVVLMQVMTVTPDRPSTLQPDLDLELEAICLKAMAKDAAKRYATMGQLADYLAMWLNGRASQPVLAPLARAVSIHSDTQVGRNKAQTGTVKPVAVPVAKAERRDTVTTRNKDRTTAEAPRRTKPKKSKGCGALAVILAGAGAFLVLACAGAVFLVVSNYTGRYPTHPSDDGANLRAGDDRPEARAPDFVARVTNVSGIDLVEIPAGSFYIGSPNDEKYAAADEMPQHKVTLTDSFYLGRYKVTRGQFRRFVDANDYKTDAERRNGVGRGALNPSWQKPGFDQTDEHPVVCVSWNDADDYCRWLADKTGAKVRLPYEAEWEYSCRATTEAKKPTTKYYFGNEGKLGDYAWYKENSGGKTHPCGERQKNDFGLYDMHGLVYEWCADGRRKYKNQDETDPVGTGGGHALRGGAFSSDREQCRSATRDFAINARQGQNTNGFRVLVERQPLAK